MEEFPIVCVGGSAGGLDAYTRLLKNLPADMGRRSCYSEPPAHRIYDAAQNSATLTRTRIQQDQTWSQQLRPHKTDGDPFVTGQIPAEFSYTAVKIAQPIQQRPKPFIPCQAYKHAIGWMGEHSITKTRRMDP